MFKISFRLLKRLLRLTGKVTKKTAGGMMFVAKGAKEKLEDINERAKDIREKERHRESMDIISTPNHINKSSNILKNKIEKDMEDETGNVIDDTIEDSFTTDDKDKVNKSYILNRDKVTRIKSDTINEENERDIDKVFTIDNYQLEPDISTVRSFEGDEVLNKIFNTKSFNKIDNIDEVAVDGSVEVVEDIDEVTDKVTLDTDTCLFGKDRGIIQSNILVLDAKSFSTDKEENDIEIEHEIELESENGNIVPMTRGGY